MNAFFTFIIGLCLFFSTMLTAQLMPKMGPYDEYDRSNNGFITQPIILFSPTPYSSIDYWVHPSSNNQSEISIAINPVDKDRLLIGVNTLIDPPGSWGPYFLQGYYYTSNGGTIWAG